MEPNVVDPQGSPQPQSTGQPPQQPISQPQHSAPEGQPLIEGSDVNLQDPQPTQGGAQQFAVQNPVFSAQQPQPQPAQQPTQQPQPVEPYQQPGQTLQPQQPQPIDHPLFQDGGHTQQQPTSPIPNPAAPQQPPAGVGLPPQPQQPGPVQPHAAATPKQAGAAKKGFNPRLVKILMVVVGIVALLAIGLAVRSLFSSGNEVAALVEESQEGISFLRPENWTKSIVEDEFIYFTEGGADINDADRGILLGSDFIGIKYESLGDDDKETIRDSFETQFSSAESFFTNESCTDVGNNKTVELQQNGYDIAFLIEASCSRTSTNEPGGTVKMFIGWTDVNLHLFGVVADTETWEKNSDKLNQIVQSIRPADL